MPDTTSPSRIGPIAWAAVRVPPGRAAAWRALTGWRAEARPVGDALAAMLGEPGAAGLDATVLTPADGIGGLVLIEIEGSVVPLTTLGWAAAELSVRDLDGVAALAQANGFRVLGEPRALGSGASIRACQLADPGGAVLYCADVRAYAGIARLHAASHLVDRVFIAVLAARDLEATRAWYAREFGVAQTSDHAVPIPVMNSAWGRLQGTTWRISSQQLAGRCLLEIDQYPPEATARQTGAFGVPGGVFAVAFVADRDIAVTAPGGERLILVRDPRVPSGTIHRRRPRGITP